MKELAITAYFSLFAVDAASTHIGLNKGGRELWLTQNAVVNDVIIASQAAAFYWATDRIKRRKVKWIVRFSIAGIHGATAAWNIKELRKK